MARNFIGFTPDGDEPRSEVQAYIENSCVTATRDLILDATADQSINSLVVAGSAAIGAGGTAGVAVSGSGVFAENKISVDVKAYINGDGSDNDDDGISADTITLAADDTSSIFAFAGAVSLAASFGGTAGVSVSVGVSLAKNMIAGDVEAFIKNADEGVTATAGSITLAATEMATINAFSGAASFAVGLAGVAGIAVAGAGAEATNVILVDTNAYVKDSVLTSSGNIDIDASNTASIDATVISSIFLILFSGLPCFFCRRRLPAQVLLVFCSFLCL